MAKANLQMLAASRSGTTVSTPSHTVANAHETNRNVLLSKNNHTGNTATPVSKYDYAVLVNGTPTAFGANSIGQRTHLDRSGSAFSADATTAWSYNTAGELTQADDSDNALDRAFSFDTIGNRITSTAGTTVTSYTADALNRYSMIGTLSPAYDADGNMTSGPLSAAPTANASLVWDGENRLISVTMPDNTIISFAYDYLGRRISKQVGSGTAIQYIYDGWNLITEYAGTTLTKSYTWGMDLSGSMQGAGGVGGLLAVNELSIINSQLSIVSYYPTYDGNGNVSEYLDSGGVVQAHYEYDAFGNTVVKTGAKADDFAHRFSTKPLDSETGLYYYGYRYYDPATGRWPSRDPIQERGGINLYGMVGNEPINRWDYLGLLHFDPNPLVFVDMEVKCDCEVIGTCNCIENGVVVPCFGVVEKKSASVSLRRKYIRERKIGAFRRDARSKAMQEALGAIWVSFIKKCQDTEKCKAPLANRQSCKCTFYDYRKGVKQEYTWAVPGNGQGVWGDEEPLKR